MNFSSFSNLLKGVSRSFYLSMRFLPNEMACPIGIAYLLARLSDTLADTVGVNPEQKLEALHLLKERDYSRLMQVYEQSYQSLLTDEREKKLIEQADRIWGYLESLEETLRKEVEAVTDMILEGQKFDVIRFEVEKSPINSAEELLKYCYQVAGCVGEFWTRVGYLTTDNFSSVPQSYLEKKGREFGIGLQLVNILRDLPEDLKYGREYIPGNLTLDQIRSSQWIQKAKNAMAQGLYYSNAMETKPTRLAVYLPAALGEETLLRLGRSNNGEWLEGIKVGRATVYREILAGFLR